MASVEARTVSASAKSNGLVDIKSLVLLAILLAAGFILNMTVGNALAPFVATFLTTLVSGALFAVVGTVMMGAPIASAMVKVPLVLGTAVFNAAVVQALYIPLVKVLGK